MRLLLNLLILVSSICVPIHVLGAEKVILPDGRTGVFISEDKAPGVAAHLKEYPHLKKQIVLYEAKVDKLEDRIELKNEKIEVIQSIADIWKMSFQEAQKEVANRESKDDVQLYIYVGLFTGGTIVGVALMYGASHLLNNLK